MNIKYIIVLVVLVGVAYVVVELLKREKGDKESDASNYKKKPYLFDTNSEFYLFKILIELYGDKYYIFPQINYSHLIEPKKSNYKEERVYRSKIDRKSADFVFCDKEKVVPILVIELDGSVHNTTKKIARDKFIDEITKVSDLPTLHIKDTNPGKEFVKSEIDKILGIS